MKTILEQWEGCFDVDGYIKKDLKDFHPKDGDEFHIKLVQDRESDSSEDKK